MNKLIQDLASMYTAVKLVAIFVLALMLLVGCHPPVAECHTDVDVGTGGDGLQPSTFNDDLSRLGLGQPNLAQVEQRYGPPCWMGDDQWATLYGYCLRGAPGAWTVYGSTCNVPPPVPGNFPNGCDQVLTFTLFKDNGLVTRYGAGVVLMRVGAAW